MSNQVLEQRLDGFYRGEVKGHCDCGRCKIWIPGAFPLEFENNPDMLPEAEQAVPFFGGNYGSNGVFSYPALHSVVWCFFQNGDQNYPVYFAAAQGGSLANSEYNNCRPESTSDKPAFIHKIKSGKATIDVNSGGEVRITLKDPKTKKNSHIIVGAAGGVWISGSETVTIGSKCIDLFATDIMRMAGKTVLIESTDGDIQLVAKKQSGSSGFGVVCVHAYKFLKVGLSWMSGWWC